MTEEYIEQGYSTTRQLTRTAPAIRSEPGSKVQTQLYFPPNPKGRSEGGLRLRSRFKSGGYFEGCSDNSHGQPLVTVVTVVYNGAAHLEKAILSVLNQTHNNVEYLIIDGGSTDGTLDLIRKYEHAIDYWVSEPDGGISNAFNKGLTVATGKLVGFLNADDWYESNAIELVVSYSKDHNADIVHGQLQYWSGQEATELVSGNHDLLQRDMTINHPTVFSRLALYRSIGGFSPDFRYAMDYDWVRRAKASGAKFCYLATPLANMGLGGVSDVRWKDAIREVARIKTLYSSNKVGPWVSYGFQLTRGIARRILEHIGLNRIVRFYHARLSLVPKIVNRDARRS